MKQLTYYEVSYLGGKYNGGRNYYKRLQDAKRVAKVYVEKQFLGLSDHVYADVWEINGNTGKQKFITTYKR